MDGALISASELGKHYKIYERPWHRVLELLDGKARHRSFRALDGISFEVFEGQSLGLIGENGAGKSTLLKLLAGVTEPSTGQIAMRGSVSSLLELGMGFHPEFSGRENIRLSAAMMGLPESSLVDLVPEIIAFSELGEFIDRPIKTYSSGMVMRLGFAIAVQVEPDILLVDEALSVGDGYFQKKCMDRLRVFLESGRTLVFCSHALYYLSSFCQTALWLRQGRQAQLGPVHEVVREYESYLLSKDAQSEGKVADIDRFAGPLSSAEQAEAPAGPARITEVSQPGKQGTTVTYRHLDPWALEVQWQSHEPGLPFHLAVGIDRHDGVQVCAFSSFHDGREPWQGQREYSALLRVPQLPLLKGEFDLNVFLLDEAGLHVYDRRQVFRAFQLDHDGFQVGLIKMDHEWEPVSPSLTAVPAGGR